MRKLQDFRCKETVINCHVLGQKVPFFLQKIVFWGAKDGLLTMFHGFSP